MALIKANSQFRFDCSAAEFAIEQVTGAEEIFRSIRQFWLRGNSKGWKKLTGTLSGLYFLRWGARAGWFEVVYTYEVDGRPFTGSLLRWASSNRAINGTEPATLAFAVSFPTGSPIELRVDPKDPSRSVVVPG